jgi:mannose/fructose/N-acetylgalactosamine-specific phosphotransferase system component IID
VTRGRAKERAVPTGDPPGALALVWRSLALQAAFNTETLQGAGFAAALLPALERAHGPGAAARSAVLSGGFNANPYLATFALGAVSAAEGNEPPERIERFLALVRGPLGSLGDSLFWGAARPAIFVPAALAVAAGARWWIALAALALFNALAFAARIGGARAGLALGLDVASSLGRSWIRRAPPLIRPAGALVIGLLAGGMLARAVGGAAPVGTGGAAGTGGLATPGAEAGPAWLALFVFGLAVPLFALWPRRFGWGLALLAVWAFAAGLASWSLA